MSITNSPFDYCMKPPLEPGARTAARTAFDHPKYPTETAMRFMIIVKATKESEAGVMPEDSLIAEMGRYHEELAQAGVLLDASGLQPSSKGWRIKYSGGKRTITDGPFAETKELLAGYTLIRVSEEALEWTKRFPNPAHHGKDSEIEVRQLFELDDFEQTEAVQRFRDLGLGSQEPTA
jgi:hypothetical protein